MKNFLTVTFVLACSMLALVACNKGDDNPYKNWRCYCFVNRAVFEDTTIYLVKDTTVLYVENMDYQSAKLFCASAQTGYVDTFGSYATCDLK